jgi:hypothetical protein
MEHDSEPLGSIKGKEFVGRSIASQGFRSMEIVVLSSASPARI